MIFETTIWRSTIADLDKRLGEKAEKGWTIVSVSLHSTLVYPDSLDTYPQSDWLICSCIDPPRGALKTEASTITPALDAAIKDEIEHGPKDIMK